MSERPPRILLVDDERPIQTLLSFPLQRDGYEVVTVADGREALARFADGGFDLVVLDLMLPKLGGLEVCRRMQAERRVPLIMLTARGAEEERLVGLGLGADDYVVKPFSVRELILRARAILRRAEGPEELEERLEFGKLRVDRAAHRAWVDGQEVSLTALELRLLLMLYDRRGRVLTRDLLLDEVWGSHADVTTRNVDTHVKRVREKLGDAGEYIETVRGVGYRFRAEPGDPGEDAERPTSGKGSGPSSPQE